MEDQGTFKVRQAAIWEHLAADTQEGSRYVCTMCKEKRARTPEKASEVARGCKKEKRGEEGSQTKRQIGATRGVGLRSWKQKGMNQQSRLNSLSLKGPNEMVTYKEYERRQEAFENQG